MRGARVLTSLLCLSGILASCHHDATAPIVAFSLGYTFTPDAGVRAASGTQPAPLVVNGAVLLYLSSGNAPNTVLRATDGLTFSPVAASYPTGTSYSVVPVSTGGYRMYFFNTATGALGSAFSTDGLNWTTEAGVRASLPAAATPRVAVIPDSGYRLFYAAVGAAAISSQVSSDGLNFFPELGFRVATTTTSIWSDAYGLNLGANGWLMAMSQFTVGVSTPSTIWLAASLASSGGVWSADSAAIVSDPTHSLADPAVIPIASGFRVYYTSTPGPVLGVTAPQPGQILSGVITK